MVGMRLLAAKQIVEVKLRPKVGDSLSLDDGVPQVDTAARNQLTDRRVKHGHIVTEPDKPAVVAAERRHVGAQADSGHQGRKVHPRRKYRLIKELHRDLAGKIDRGLCLEVLDAGLVNVTGVEGEITRTYAGESGHLIVNVENVSDRLSEVQNLTMASELVAADGSHEILKRIRRRFLLVVELEYLSFHFLWFIVRGVIGRVVAVVDYDCAALSGDRA